MSINSNVSKMIWEGTIAECMKKGSLFVDFIVFGIREDEFLKSSGFRLINNKLKNQILTNLSTIHRLKKKIFIFLIRFFIAWERRAL